MTSDYKLLRRPDVERKVKLGCSAIYARLDPKSAYYDPTFPKPIRLGSGKNPPVAWIDAELDAWIKRQVDLSRAEPVPGRSRWRQ